MVFCRMRWNSSGSSAAGFAAYFSASLQHRVLHQVERQMLVADREHRLLERPALDLGEEGRELFFCCQRRCPLVLRSRDDRQQAGC